MLSNLLKENIVWGRLEFWWFRLQNYLRSFNPYLASIFIICIAISMFIEFYGTQVSVYLRHPLNYLSYSYISAYIFYVLVVYTPEYNRKRIIDLYVHNRTAMIVQITWRVYWHLLSKGGGSEKEIDEVRYQIPQRKALYGLLEKNHPFSKLNYLDLNFHKQDFQDYDDLLDEIGRVLLIYVNDLFRVQKSLDDNYFEKLILLEQSLQINNFKAGGQRIKSGSVENLAFRLNTLLTKTISLKILSEKSSYTTFKRQNYIAKIERLKRKGENNDL